VSARRFYFRITGGDGAAGFDCTISQEGGTRRGALRRVTEIAQYVAAAIGVDPATLQIADALPPPGTDELLQMAGVER
jgi:3-polyprenyl-4-hydroxybenzoate decarboxylase